MVSQMDRIGCQYDTVDWHKGRVFADLYAGSPIYRNIKIRFYSIPMTQASDAGPFIKLGPLRNSPELAERVGVVSAAGLVVILTLW